MGQDLVLSGRICPFAERKTSWLWSKPVREADPDIRGVDAGLANGHGMAIRREDGKHHGIIAHWLLVKRANANAALGVTEHDLRVLAGRHQTPAVGRERDTPDNGVMSRDDGSLVTARHIPQADRPIICPQRAGCARPARKSGTGWFRFRVPEAPLNWPDLQDQIATDPLPAAPKREPSGENATACRSELCGKSTGSRDGQSSSRLVSQMRTKSLQPQAARIVPSGEKATLSTTCTAPPWARIGSVGSTEGRGMTAEPIDARAATTVPNTMSWPIQTERWRVTAAIRSRAAHDSERENRSIPESLRSNMNLSSGILDPGSSGDQTCFAKPLAFLRMRVTPPCEIAPAVVNGDRPIAGLLRGLWRGTSVRGAKDYQGLLLWSDVVLCDGRSMLKLGRPNGGSRCRILWDRLGQWQRKGRLRSDRNRSSSSACPFLANPRRECQATARAD